MCTRAARVGAGVAIFAMASLVSVDFRPGSTSPTQPTTAIESPGVTVSVIPRAEAFFRRLFRRIGRAFRRVGRAIARGFRKVGRAIGRVARKVGRAVGKGFKKMGRAVGKGFKKMGRAMGKGFKKVGRAMGKGFKKMGRAIGKAAKKVGRAVVKAAKSVGKGVWKGVKTMGKGFVKVGKGVVKVGKGVGKAVVGVGKAVGKFTKGTFKAAGKFFKGDIKGARRSFVSGAKGAGRAVVSGAKSGWKDIKKGAGQVLSGAKDVASGALDVITLGQKDKILALIKKVMSSKLFQVVTKIATKLLDKLGGVLGSKRLVKALKIVSSVLSVGHQIVSAIHNPGLYLQAGREAAIERLADLAMKVLITPIRKLAGAAMGTLISLGKHFVTVPLSAAIASALGSVTFGIGAGLAPLIKLGIDRFLEWAIDQITDKLAGLALKIGAIRNFLKDRLIKPVINKLYDKLITLIRNKIPALAKKLTTSAEHEAGVRPEALVKGLGGVAQVLGKAAKIARKVEGVARKAQRAKARKGRRKARTSTRKPTRVARKATRPGKRPATRRPAPGAMARKVASKMAKTALRTVARKVAKTVARRRAPRVVAGKVVRRPAPRLPGRIFCIRPPCPQPKAGRTAPVGPRKVAAAPWYRRPGACPDGWRLLKFDGKRVHCMASANNRGRCARISVFTQSYNRCGWASGCQTRWTSAGCGVAKRPPPRVVAARRAPPPVLVPGGLVNLALHKRARQSSVGWGGVAGRAVDGNPNGRYPARSVTHTQATPGAWWEVDLGSLRRIERIQIWNRTDCCRERLRDFYVMVSPRPFRGPADLRSADVWKQRYRGIGGTPTTIRVGAVGRYVRVMLAGRNYLSLAEVKVLGSPRVARAPVVRPVPARPTVMRPPIARTPVVRPEPTRPTVMRPPVVRAAGAKPRVAAPVSKAAAAKPRAVGAVSRAPAPRPGATRPPHARGSLSDLRRGLQQAYREASRARIAALKAARALTAAAKSLATRARVLRALAGFRRGVQSAYRIVYAMRSRMRRALARLSGGALTAALRALGSRPPLPALQSGGPPLAMAEAALARLEGEGRRYVQVAVAVLPALQALRARFEQAARGAQSGLREAAAAAGKGVAPATAPPAS